MSDESTTSQPSFLGTVGKKWLNIWGRLPPQLVFFGVLWGAFVIWTASETYTNGMILFERPSPSPRLFDRLFDLSGYSATTIMFAVNAWSCAAALAFGVIFSNPFAWLNGTRLIFGSITFAMILVRLVSGAFSYIGLITTSVDPLLTFAAAPFVLMFSGGATFIGVASTVGVLFGTLSAFL